MCLNSTPNFTTPLAICNGATAPVLNNTSNSNGISGTWSPSTISNTITADYIFTPNVTMRRPLRFTWMCIQCYSPTLQRRWLFAMVQRLQFLILLHPMARTERGRSQRLAKERLYFRIIFSTEYQCVAVHLRFMMESVKAI
jgi:hypothetical protein